MKAVLFDTRLERLKPSPSEGSAPEVLVKILSQVAAFVTVTLPFILSLIR